VISIMTVMQDESAVEVATVGNEGMVGVSVFLGERTSPVKLMVQVPGEALRVKAEAFKEQAFRHEAFLGLLLRYLHARFIQLAQSVACNSMHSLQSRCCRWLLMTHERVGDDEFPLTQEFLAQMLGVRRASISSVARRLQKTGLIRYSRGKIAI